MCATCVIRAQATPAVAVAAPVAQACSGRVRLAWVRVLAALVLAVVHHAHHYTLVLVPCMSADPGARQGHGPRGPQGHGPRGPRGQPGQPGQRAQAMPYQVGRGLRRRAATVSVRVLTVQVHRVLCCPARTVPACRVRAAWASRLPGAADVGGQHGVPAPLHVPRLRLSWCGAHGARRAKCVRPVPSQPACMPVAWLVSRAVPTSTCCALCPTPVVPAQPHPSPARRRPPRQLRRQCQPRRRRTLPSSPPRRARW